VDPSDTIQDRFARSLYSLFSLHPSSLDFIFYEHKGRELAQYRGSRKERLYATVFLRMATRPQNPPEPDPDHGSLYCPNCAEEVNDPLTCGDCSSVICRRCGTALESPDELGIG
jgi:hypothetical protein